MPMEHALIELAEPINIHIQDPIAKRIVRVLKNTFITPNQVTYLSVLAGFASGYSFSQGTWVSSFIGGLLLELTLILDCVDGQLARAKNMASDWGRLIDGIAGYFAYLAVVYGIISGYPDFSTAVIVIAVFTILRAISYDYCKQTMGLMALKGFDGVEREIQSTFEKLQKNTSGVLFVYFYYMQAQRLIFQGKWETLGDMKNREVLESPILNSEQRQEYLNKVRFLIKIWRWNGIDFPLFLIAVLGLLSIPGQSLNFLAVAIAAQFLITYLLHFFLNRKI
ncbi:MAG: CDP-alcohol phosphatidyltransferase family protein [Nitrospinae bacterium]|nr:CDP-alcohol phosphatidyltransferase family protein [Nitrospinota bacterium]